MRKTIDSTGKIVVCVLIVAIGWAAGQDWPQWRGAGRDGKAADFSAPAKWPGQLTEKWKVTVGSGDATPDLVGDKLYVFTRQGDEEVTLCLNAATGKEIWKDKYTADAVTGAASRHPGPRSTPAVADGKVVTMGVAGVLSCLDAASGKVVWRKDPFPKMVPKFFTSTSPIIVDGAAIAHLGKEGNGAIIAYDLNSGDKKWEWSEEGPAYASPAVLKAGGTKQIVTLTEKSVVGINAADGKLLWRISFVPQGRAYNAATPIIDGNTVIYTGAGRGATAVKIEKQGDGFVTRELWSNPDLAPQYNTPVLKDGFLYGLSNQSNLYCIDAKTGKTAWTDTTKQDRSGFGAIVDAGDCLLALPSSAELIAYKPSGSGYSELAKIKVSDTAIYAYPVIAGKNIYIKDQETLALCTVE